MQGKEQLSNCPNNWTSPCKRRSKFASRGQQRPPFAEDEEIGKDHMSNNRYYPGPFGRQDFKDLFILLYTYIQPNYFTPDADEAQEAEAVQAVEAVSEIREEAPKPQAAETA